MESKFKTKIVQRFKDSFEFYELFLPDGRCVASGSLDHCWNERERYESLFVEPVQLSFDF